MSDRPLGVVDLIVNTAWDPRVTRDTWFWCRRHKEAHKVRKVCYINDSTMPIPNPCIDIGPFMSEREANRLSGTRDQHRHHEPLSMEVER